MILPGSRIKNQNGFVTGMTLFMLAIFTVLGISTIILATTELQIAANDQFLKIAFYGAEAARGYVPRHPELYGEDNVREDESLSFPNQDESSEKQLLGPDQEFNGQVIYFSASTPPRGSGFEVGTFRAHKYQMTCNGYGPRNSESHIEAGFYRIGF